MAVTAAPYIVFLTNLGTGQIDFTSDAINVALLDNTYSPDTSHSIFDDIASAEITGTGYAPGGITLASVDFSHDSGAGTATVFADPLIWAALSDTIHYAVIYKFNGYVDDLPTGDLIGWIDFGEDKTYTAEPFQLSFPSGVVLLTIA